MAAELSEAQVIERGPYEVVGCYAVCEGDDEPWDQATAAFLKRRNEIDNRVGNALLGFLYRPHRDDPAVSETVRSCFVGVEVADRADVPAGMATTLFSGGRFVTVTCTADTELEAAMAVGDAVQALDTWVREHGFVEGDSCFCYSDEHAPRPPYVEYVQMRFEEARNAPGTFPDE